MPVLCFKFMAKVKEERGPKTVVVVVCSLFCFFLGGVGVGWGVTTHAWSVLRVSRVRVCFALSFALRRK